AALLRLEAAERLREEHPVLHGVEGLHRACRVRVELVGLRRPGRIERKRYVLLLGAELPCDLGARGRTAEARGELPLRVDRRAPEFDNAARKPHTAPAIAQVAPDLSGDIGHREGR